MFAFDEEVLRSHSRVADDCPSAPSPRVLRQMYKFDLEPTTQTAAWSSAWIKSALYNRSAAMGKEAPTVQFKETTPSRGYTGLRK